MTLDQMPYTANAHPTRSRGGASHHDDGRLDVQGRPPTPRAPIPTPQVPSSAFVLEGA
jgi:hypothetical protein